MLARTKEQIMSRKKSLKLQNIKTINNIIANLKNRVLFNFILNYFFSEYPKPFDLA